MVADTENTGALNDTIKNVLDNLIRLTETIDATDPQKIKIWADAISALLGALAGWRAGGGGKAGGILAVVGAITGLAASESTFGESVRDTNEAIDEQAKKLQQISDADTAAAKLIGSYEMLAREIDFAKQNLESLVASGKDQSDQEKDRTAILARLEAQIDAVAHREVEAGKIGETAILEVLNADNLRKKSIGDIITLLGKQGDVAVSTAKQEREARAALLADEIKMQQEMVKTLELQMVHAAGPVGAARGRRQMAEEDLRSRVGPGKRVASTSTVAYDLRKRVEKAKIEERAAEREFARAEAAAQEARGVSGDTKQRLADLLGYAINTTTPGSGAEPDDGTDKTARAGRSQSWPTFTIPGLEKVKGGEWVDLAAKMDELGLTAVQRAELLQTIVVRSDALAKGEAARLTTVLAAAEQAAPGIIALFNQKFDAAEAARRRSGEAAGKFGPGSEPAAASSALPGSYRDGMTVGGFRIVGVGSGGRIHGISHTRPGDNRGVFDITGRSLAADGRDWGEIARELASMGLVVAWRENATDMTSGLKVKTGDRKIESDHFHIADPRFAPNEAAKLLNEGNSRVFSGTFEPSLMKNAAKSAAQRQARDDAVAFNKWLIALMQQGGAPARAITALFAKREGMEALQGGQNQFLGINTSGGFHGAGEFGGLKLTKSFVDEAAGEVFGLFKALQDVTEAAGGVQDALGASGLEAGDVSGLQSKGDDLLKKVADLKAKYGGKGFDATISPVADGVGTVMESLATFGMFAKDFQMGQLTQDRLDQLAELGIAGLWSQATTNPEVIRERIRGLLGKFAEGDVAGTPVAMSETLAGLPEMLGKVQGEVLMGLLRPLEKMEWAQRANLGIIPGSGSAQKPLDLPFGALQTSANAVKDAFVKAILDNATRSIADVDRGGSLEQQIKARQGAMRGLGQGLLESLDPEQRQQIEDKLADLAEAVDGLGAKLLGENFDALVANLEDERGKREQTIALAEKRGGKSAGDIARGASFIANQGMLDFLLGMAQNMEAGAQQLVDELKESDNPETAAEAREKLQEAQKIVAKIKDELGLNEAERGGFLADLADDLTKATEPISDELSKLRQETARQGLGTIARSVMEINDKADELLDKVLFDIAAKYAAMAAAIDPSALEGLSALQAQDEAAARGQLDQLRKGRIGNQLRGTIEEMDLAAGERGTARSMRRQQLGLIGASPLQQQIGQVAIALASERARIAMKRDKNLKRGQQLGPDGQPLLNDDQMKDLRDGYRKEEIEAEEDASDRIVEIYRNRFVELRNMHQDFFKSIIMDIGSVESAFKRLSTQIISDSVDRMLEGWGVLGGLAGGNMRGAYGLPGGGRMGGVMPYAAAGGAMAGGMMIQGSNGQMIPVAMSPNAASGKAASKGYAQLPSYEQLGITPKTAGSYSGLGGSNTISQAIGFSGIGLNAYQSKNPLSSTLSGGVQGFALGGPLGAAIGGGVGLLGSLIGGLFGGRKADPRKDPDPYSLPTQADLQFAAPWLLPRQAFLGGRTGGGAEMVDQSQNFEIHGDLVFPSVTDEASAEGAARAFRRELSSGRSDVAVKLQAHLDRVPVSR